ncbi:VCBS repeat-containing protein [bacterium]|nr:VCBS repeat-containing protein [candidate division CSSED10-310 bacterium]
MMRHFWVFVLIAGVLPALPAAGYFIQVDGNPGDWPLAVPAAVNTGHVARDIGQSGQYIWKDEGIDERNDFTSPARDAHVDLTEFRVTADSQYIYFLARFTDLQIETSDGAVQLQIGIDIDRTAGSGNEWFGRYCDTKLNMNAYWDQLLVTRLGSGASTPLIYDSAWNEEYSGSQAASGANDAIEVAMPWTSIHGMHEVLRFTVAVFRANASDDTWDLGSDPVSDALDCVTNYTHHPGASGSYNTWDEVSDQVVDYYFDIWFEVSGHRSTGDIKAPLLVYEVVPDAVNEPEGEWVAIYNNTSVTLDLTDFMISDEETCLGGEGTYSFQTRPCDLASGDTFIIANEAVEFKAVYGCDPDFELNDSDTGIADLVRDSTPIWSSGTMSLGNSGDEVLILDPSYTVVDALVYGSGSYPSVYGHASVAQGHGLLRCHTPQDTDECGMDFSDDTAPAPCGVQPTSTPEPSPTITPSATPGTGDEPCFGSAVNIRREAHRIAGSGWEYTLEVTDWDNDGRLDLLGGNSDGRLELTMNTGTAAAPAFADGQWLQYSGYGYMDISADSHAAPAHIDWNGDGKRDLLVGNYWGEVLFFENSGTDTAPAFTWYEYLQTGYSAVDVGQLAQPVPVDWDNDGRDDLLVGAGDGTVRLFMNIGSQANPELAPGVTVPAGYGIVDVGNSAKPWVTDWNGDGAKDLVVWGESPPKTYLYLNAGSDGAPVFGYGELLFSTDTPVIIGEGMDFAMADMDGDSKEDIMTVSPIGATLWYPNHGTNAGPEYLEARYIPGDEPSVMFEYGKGPRVVDWDEDGRKDLVLNTTYNGRHYVIFNGGTNGAPSFTSQLHLTTTAGVTIPSGFDYHSPEIIDWDNDGRKDLLVANPNWSGGDVYLYPNVGENYEPVLGPPQRVASYAILPWGTLGVEVADWDQDGRKDLLLGTSVYGPSGQCNYVYFNQGTDAAPVFSGGYAALLTYGFPGTGYAIPGPRLTCPHVWDYEEDGVPDLFMTIEADNRRLRRYRNAAGPGATTLVDDGFIETAYGYIQGNCEIFPEVTDWNEDGRKDLLVGSCPGLYLYPNTQTGLSAPDEVSGLTVIDAGESFVALIWQNPAPADFAGVLAVRSEQPVTWRPSDRQHYHVTPGTEVAPGVSVVYKGAEDHSVTPWEDDSVAAGRTYHYRLFTFDMVVPNYSVTGSEVWVMTSAPTTVPTPVPTFTPPPSPTGEPTMTPTMNPTLTPAPTASPTDIPTATASPTASPSFTPALTPTATVIPTPAPIPATGTAGAMLLLAAMSVLAGRRVDHRRR